MTTILHIQSSSNLKGNTRTIGAALIDTLAKANPGAKIVTRDVVTDPLPHVSPDFVRLIFAGNDAAPELALSEKIVTELLNTDILVIEAPLYNFGMPSALKAWIDHAIRKGRTFNYTEKGPEGLTNVKKAYLITSSGGVYTEGFMTAFEHTESHLRSVLNFIGITNIETIRADGMSMGPEHAATSLANALGHAKKVAA